MFVLISGYFGIRLSVKSFLNFYLLCLFYNITAWLVHSYDLGFSIKELVYSLFVTKTDNWFFPAYLWLMFLSPIINIFVQNTDLNRLRIIVYTFVILTIVSGYLLSYNANPNGYTVLHLVFVYLIGALIKKEKERLGKKYYMMSYILCALINGCLCSVLVNHTSWNGMYCYHYNNPLVLTASISLFLFFEKVEIQSKTTNKIASTVVAALLIQDVVLRHLMVKSLKDSLSIGPSSFIVNSILWFVSFFVCAFIVETVRKPLADKLIGVIVRVVPDKYRNIHFS